MPATTANQRAVVDALHYLIRAFLSGGAATVADARAKLSAALATYDAP
jgi:hypothetical protein